MKHIKRLVWVLFVIGIGLGVAHAVVNSQADKVARGFIDDLVAQLNAAGVLVTVGEVTANPYNKSILVRKVNIVDPAGYRHTIDTLTLKNIELNATQDFIEAMYVEARDGSIDLLSPAINAEPSDMVKAHFKALDIEGGRVGYHQTMIYRYEAENTQLSLETQSEFFHPQNDAEPLFDLAVKTKLNRVPDLQLQFAEMNNPEMANKLAAAWLDVALKKAHIQFQDQGAWEPIIRAGAENAGVSENIYREQLKKQWIATWASLNILPVNLHEKLQTSIEHFVDSEQPMFNLEIDSTLPDGSGLMLVMMSSLISPAVLNNFFTVELEAK